MRRALRWLVRGLVAVVALVVVALIVVVIVLHTDWGREQLRSRVEAALAGSFPGGAHVGKIEGSVLGELVVENLELDGIDHRPWLIVREARLRAGLVPLLGKTVRVDELIVRDAVLDLRVPRTTPAPEAPSSPSTWTLALRGIDIERARVIVDGADGPLDIHDIAVGANARIEGDTIVAVASARGQLLGRTLEASGLVRISAERIELPLVVARATSPTGAPARIVAIGARAAGENELLGAIAASLPAGAAKELAGVDLPGDLALAVIAPRNRQAIVGGTLALPAGIVPFRGWLVGNYAKRRTRFLLNADVPPTAQAQSGTVVAALQLNKTGLRGMISAEGHGIAVLQNKRFTAKAPADAKAPPRASDARASRASGRVSGGVLASSGALAVNSSSSAVGIAGIAVGTSKAWASTTVTGPDVHVRAWANAFRQGDTWTLKNAALRARAGVTVRGEHTFEAALATELRGSGRVYPDQDLTFTGTADADGLRADDARAESAHVAIDHATYAKHELLAHGDVAVTKIVRGSTVIPLATAVARVAVAGDAIDVRIERHKIVSLAGEWTGEGGQIAIDPGTIVIKDLRTSHGSGLVTANATVTRATGDLVAKAKIQDLTLASFAPKTRGTVAGTLDVTRRGGRLGGTIDLHGRGVVADPAQPAPVDVDAKLGLAGRRATATITGRTSFGAATLAADVDGPADPTDVAAWKRLARGNVRSLSLAVDQLDLHGVGGSGVVDGELALTASGARGDLRVRGVHTQTGDLDADVTLSPGLAGEIEPGFDVTLAGVGAAHGDARIVLPHALFDPVAWRALGADAVRAGSVRAQGIAITPALAASFGSHAPYTATVDAGITIDPGIRGANVAVDVHELHGGRIVQPLDLHADAAIDRAGSQATITATRHAGSVRLVELSPRSSLTIDRLRDGIAAIRAASLGGTVDVGHREPGATAAGAIGVKDLLAIIGRGDVLAGTASGGFTLTGTLGAPTGSGQLAVTGLTIPARIAGRKPVVLDALAIETHWNGDTGDIKLRGTEGQGFLELTASGDPRRLDSVIASLQAYEFEIGPLAAFAPGALGGTRGKLAGALKLHGLDTATGDLRGILQISDARMPVSERVGTLRNADVRLEVKGREVDAHLTGRLGSGDLSGDATLTFAGLVPKTAVADLTLHHVSPVATIEPLIDGQIHASFTSDGERWAGDVTVRRGSVLVTPESSAPLLDVTSPGDMIFVDKPPPVDRKALLKRPPPSHPWLTARVDLGDTTVKADIRDFGNANAIIAGRVTVTVGEDSVGMDGSIDASRGDATLFGRRYDLDHGRVTFDGTIDPLLDLRLVHDFAELTLTADITGRPSDPDLALSGDPGIYSQSQLIAFFFGAEPGGDPAAATGEAATGAATSVLSNRLTKQANKVLPIKLDDINYEPATTSTSAAQRFGKWVTKKLYVAVRHHFDPRPDENTNEAFGEWYLRRNLMLQGTAGDQGFGGDLLWRRRW